MRRTLTTDQQEIECENLCQQKYEERLKDEDFGDTKYGRIRKYFWNLTEYPETSRAAQVRRQETVITVVKCGDHIIITVVKCGDHITTVVKCGGHIRYHSDQVWGSF